MTKKMVQRCLALAKDKNGAPVVMCGHKEVRQQRTGEVVNAPTCDARLAFINAISLDEIMEALNAMCCEGHYFFGTFSEFEDLQRDECGHPYTWFDDSIQSYKATIAQMLYGASPTRTQVKHTENAMMKWGISGFDFGEKQRVEKLAANGLLDLLASDEGTFGDSTGLEHAKQLFPLDGIIQARNDLLRIARALAFLRNRHNDAWTLDEALSAGAFEALDTHGKTAISSFYLKWFTAEVYTSPGLVRHEEYGPTQNPTPAEFVADASNMLRGLYPVYKEVGPLDCDSEGDIFLDCLFFVFQRLTQQFNQGSLAVCPYCHKLFEQRSDKPRRFCKDEHYHEYLDRGRAVSSLLRWPSETFFIEPNQPNQANDTDVREGGEEHGN